MVIVSPESSPPERILGLGNTEGAGFSANEHEWAWVGHFPEIVAGFEDFRG
jgi:hypothetical protein